MPTQIKDPKSRTADFAVRLMATTAEHLRDCRHCYETLLRRVGEKGDEKAAMVGEQFTLAPIMLVPSGLWPLFSELYPAFVTYEHWPKVEGPF